MTELYPFQKYAVDFFLEKRSVLLADDMGLGKTVQAIALDQKRRESQPNLVKHPKTLIITYLGVISSWKSHLKDWTPHLRVCAINNKDRKLFKKALADGDFDVYIIHWQGLRLLSEELYQIVWFSVIADECHALQNRKSLQTKAAKRLRTWYKVGLSGTPAYDKPDDLWSILNWLYPSVWTSYWRYYHRHIVFTEYNGYRTIVGVCNVEELQQQLSGFYLRRKKEDVLLDLPDKYYSAPVEVELTPKQKRAYRDMTKEMLAWIGANEDQPVNAPIVISQLTRLQQFSDAFGEIDLDTGKMIVTEPSSKLDAVMHIINSSSEPIVVFSQFSQIIKLLGKRLENVNISHGLFIGDTPAEARSKILDDFQAGRLRVFAGTIQAGGVGITLTASSTVVFIDRSWSHSMNRQAEDRLWRIGQKNAVNVIDILSRGTIDMKRKKEIELKWDWIKELLGEEDE